MYILRVSERPTILYPGKGMAAYVLSSAKDFNTLLYSPLPQHGDQNIDINTSNCIQKNFIRRFYSADNFSTINIFKPIKFILLLIYTLFVNLNILFTLPNRKFDLIHIHHPFYSPLLLWAWSNGIPTVYTSHGYDCIRIKNIHFLRILFSLVDIIFCMSNEQINIYSKLYPKKKIIFASNGVDNRLFSSSLKFNERKNRIVCVGSLSWKKDYITILKSVKRFLEVFPQWKLVIVGTGSDKDQLIRLSNDLNISNNVVFAGIKNRTEIANLLSESKIYLINSIQEGLPKSLLEAMASGCACVSTNVGECENVLKSCGIVIKPNSIESTYKALHKLAYNNELANELSIKAIERAHRYSWGNYVHNHINYYDELVNAIK